MVAAEPARRETVADFVARVIEVAGVDGPGVIVSSRIRAAANSAATDAVAPASAALDTA